MKNATKNVQSYLRINKKRPMLGVPGMKDVLPFKRKATPHAKLRTSRRPPHPCSSSDEDGGGGGRVAQRSNPTGNLDQTKGSRKDCILLPRLWRKWEKYFTSGQCFNMKNDPYSLSIKLLVHPSIVGLNNISLNNCESLLVLFLPEKKKWKEENITYWTKGWS